MMEINGFFLQRKYLWFDGLINRNDHRWELKWNGGNNFSYMDSSLFLLYHLELNRVSLFSSSLITAVLTFWKHSRHSSYYIFKNCMQENYKNNICAHIQYFDHLSYFGWWLKNTVQSYVEEEGTGYCQISTTEGKNPAISA